MIMVSMIRWLLQDNDQYSPPQTFEEMLKICPMYPETATMFVHQVCINLIFVFFEIDL